MLFMFLKLKDEHFQLIITLASISGFHAYSRSKFANYFYCRTRGSLAITTCKQKQEIRKIRPTHGLTTLASSPQPDFRTLQMVRVTSKLRLVPAWLDNGAIEIPRVIQVVWRFPTQSLLRAYMCAGLHVQCLLLLFDLNQNCNVLINLCKTQQYRI